MNFLNKKTAHGTLEFAITFLLLSIILFSVIEIAIYFRTYYMVQALTDDIEANLSSYSVSEICTELKPSIVSLLEEKTGTYLYTKPSFTTLFEDDVYVLNSSDTIASIPRVRIKLDCSNTDKYGVRVSVYHVYKGAYILSNGQIIKSVSGTKTPKF